MTHRCIGLLIAVFCVVATNTASAGICDPYLESRTMNTYDTGTRLLNGQWIIGSTVSLYSHSCTGEFTSMDWTAAHIIADVFGTSTLASSGTLHFTDYQFYDTLSGTAAYSTCYQGKATAAISYIGGSAGNDYGGNTICTDAAPSGGGGGGGGCVPTETNPCNGGNGPGGGWNNRDCGYNNVEFGGCASPIVIDVDHGSYPMSGPASPVQFDLNADGDAETSTWTAAGSTVGFLALDRNGNHQIDDGTELFGNHTPLGNGHVAANGFEALAVFDANGDGVIDSADPIWPSLLLWIDGNHNARSEPEELHALSALGVRSISLDYHTNMRRDAFGNLFRYEGSVQLGNGTRHIYDVFLRIRQ